MFWHVNAKLSLAKLILISGGLFNFSSGESNGILPFFLSFYFFFFSFFFSFFLFFLQLPLRWIAWHTKNLPPDQLKFSFRCVNERQEFQKNLKYPQVTVPLHFPTPRKNIRATHIMARPVVVCDWSIGTWQRSMAGGKVHPKI